MFIFFRWLFKNVPPEMEAKTLVEKASASAYGVFVNEDFRRLVEFGKQNEEEQNRIFNELVVTGTVLLILTVDLMLQDIKPERQHFWRAIRAKVPEIYCEWLSSLGVAKKFVNIWKKLIDLRLKEYDEGQRDTLKIWAEEFKNNKDKDVLTESAALVETLTIGSMMHITRGKAKTNADDPLRRHLRTWTSVLYHNLNRRIGW